MAWLRTPRPRWQPQHPRRQCAPIIRDEPGSSPGRGPAGPGSGLLSCQPAYPSL